MTTRDRLPSKYFPTSGNFDIQTWPMYWLARLASKYSLAMEKRLKRVGMDVPRWRVAILLKLYSELSISQLAEHSIVKLPTITKIVYRMQDEGLVSIKTSETDGRVSIVSLTEQGAAKLRSVDESTDKLFARVFEGLSEAELERFMATMQIGRAHV